MKFIKFSYDTNLGYIQNETSGYDFQMLGFFLTGEVGPKDLTYKDWVLDPTTTFNYGNMIAIKKKITT